MVDNVVNNPPRSSRRDLCGRAASTLNRLRRASPIYMHKYIFISSLFAFLAPRKVSRSAPSRHLWRLTQTGHFRLKMGGFSASFWLSRQLKPHPFDNVAKRADRRSTRRKFPEPALVRHMKLRRAHRKGVR